jgi:hypothetical protein
MSTQLGQVLDAINGALSVIKAVANTPGLNVIPYAATISSAISAIQAAESLGMNILPYITAIKDTFSPGNTPSAADVAALDAKIAELEIEVAAALPPKEDGELD